MNKIKKQLEGLLHLINKLDPKCNDTNLSEVYNKVCDILDSIKEK